MKKFFNLAIITLLLIGIFFIYDYRSARIQYNDEIKQRCIINSDDEICNNNNQGFSYPLKIINFKSLWESENWQNDKDISHTKTKCEGEKCKPSILILGCSCANGAGLDYSEKFSYKLYEMSNRTVYNFSVDGGGLSEMIYELNQPDLYKKIDSTPDYAIYVYLPHHLIRLYDDRYGLDQLYMFYSIKNGKIVNDKFLFIKLNKFKTTKEFMFKFFHYFVYPKWIFNEKNKDKEFDIVKLYFETARNELRKKYPDIKFIILKYPMVVEDIYPAGEYVYNCNRWRELEDEGFIVIDLNEYTGVDIIEKEYLLKNGHPNKKTWDIVVEKLINDKNIGLL